MENSKMLKEIKETPYVIRNLFEFEKDNIVKIAERIRQYDPSFAILSGRGSSDNACIYGQYILEFISGIPVSLATGSIYTVYKRPPDISRGLIVGLSQSGETDDVCAIIDYAEKVGAMSIGVTNSQESKLYSLAKENRIYMAAGKEESVCATKSFSASIMSLLMLAFSINELSLDLDKIIEPIEKVLSEEETIKKITQKYIFSSDIVVLGTGFSYSIALETALKLRESCYINALGMSSVDFLHGPIAILTPTIPVIMFIPDEETLEVNLSIIQEIKKIGAHVLVVSDNEYALKEGDTGFRISKNTNFLYPFSEVIFSQIFAYYLSVSRKINPDVPRFLHKVTRVEF
jgi:glucosamine--fructose-6-phosphate aminotransferase (isomerizing)